MKEEKKEKVKNIYEALLEFQTNNKWLVVKDSDNPFFKSKYADLTAMSHACREGLAACGIVVIQEPITLEHGAGCKTTLMHAESGSSINSELILPWGQKRDPQAAGSAITYARRYSLSSILGLVAADEDDDGNHASGNEKPAAKESQKPFIKVTENAGSYPKVERSAPTVKESFTPQKPKQEPIVKTPLKDDDVPDTYTQTKAAFPDSEEILIRFKYDLNKVAADKLDAVEKYIEKAGQKFYTYIDKDGIAESEQELPRLKQYQIDLVS